MGDTLKADLFPETQPRADVVRVERSRSRLHKQRWWWTRFDGNNREALAKSTEGYANRAHAVAMAKACNRPPYRLFVDGAEVAP